MKKSGLSSVVLFGLCAVIWSAKAIYEIADTPRPAAPFRLISDAVCAVCWTAVFIVQLIKHIKSKAKKEE